MVAAGSGFLTVALTPRDRAAVHARYTLGADWGGSAEALELRASIWETLRLDELGGAELRDLSAGLEPFELSAEQVAHLRTTIPAPVNLPRDLGLALAMVLRRLRTESVEA